MELVAEFVLIGLVNGGIYVVLGLGLTLLFGVSRIINVAHGELFAIGGYVVFFAVGAIGVHSVLGLLLAIIAAFLIGVAINELLVSPLRTRPMVQTPLEFFLILTLGLSIALQGTMLLVFGAFFRSTPPLFAGSITVFGLTLASQRAFIIIATGGIVALLFLFLNKTRTGTAIRATSQDRDAARAVGIDVRRLDSLVFGISAALAAAAGGLATSVIFLFPQIGLDWMLPAIVVIIVGGLGSPVGTLLAGYGLGIVESLSVMVIPAQFKLLVGLTAMVVVLMFRPSGLLGRRIEGDA